MQYFSVQQVERYIKNPEAFTVKGWLGVREQIPSLLKKNLKKYKANLKLTIKKETHYDSKGNLYLPAELVLNGEVIGIVKLRDYNNSIANSKKLDRGVASTLKKTYENNFLLSMIFVIISVILSLIFFIPKFRKN